MFAPSVIFTLPPSVTSSVPLFKCNIELTPSPLEPLMFRETFSLSLPTRPIKEEALFSIT